MTGLYLEDLPPGLVLDHALRRTVTETDNLLFTSLTMNTQPLHLDVEFARESVHGGLIVNSLFTLGLANGIPVTDLTHGTTVGNLSMGPIDFPTPVRIGDTIRVETEVLAARPSQTRPSVGIVDLEHRAFNQRDELVCRCQRTAMMLRRPTRTNPGHETAVRTT